MSRIDIGIIQFLIGRIARKFKDGDLPTENYIRNLIEKAQSYSSENLSIILDEDISDDLRSDIDWNQIDLKIRQNTLVKHEIGNGIINHDATYNRRWFSNLKIKEDFQSYYSSRFNSFYSEKLPPQVIYTLKQDTEQVLNFCGSPKREDYKNIRGLVFGNVQAGKTLNYCSIANASMDSGYDMIVILAGATNILRKQTQSRVNSDIIGFDGSGSIGVGRFASDPSRQPISITTLESGFTKRTATAQLKTMTFGNISVPLVAVMLKNKTALENLNDWLQIQAGGRDGVIQKSILLIDDESDYASVDTNKRDLENPDEHDPTTINGLIRNILRKFSVSTYLAVTATPFANILINNTINDLDYGEDLFPQDFIWALEKPSTYVGVKETIVNKFVDLYTLDEDKQQELKDEIRFTLNAQNRDHYKQLPNYIKHSICYYLTDSLNLRLQQPDFSHISMLINVSRFTNHHEELSALISSFLEYLKNAIDTLSKNQITDGWISILLKIAKSNYEKSLDFDNYWEQLKLNIGKTEVFDIHRRTRNEVSWEEGIKRNSILVGGLSLSRGYTIEGLITSTFLRTTKTFDTLMQMGRWFGHKSHIIDHVRIFTTPTIKNRFELIDDSILDLLEQLKEMKELELSPRHFGLNIKEHPQVVIEKAVEDLVSRQGIETITSNKRRWAERMNISLSLDAKNMETVRFLNEEKIYIENNNITENFIKSISNQNIKYDVNIHSELYVDGPTIGWLSVKNDDVKNYLKSFILPKQTIGSTRSKLPLRFIYEFLDDQRNSGLLWDVSIVQGKSEKSIKINNNNINLAIRSFTDCKNSDEIQIPKRQLSGVANESRFLPKRLLNEFKGNRSEMRSVRKKHIGKPLLLLYPIDPKRQSDEEELVFVNPSDVPIWGYSISMPGEISDQIYKSVLANPVYIDEYIALLDNL